MARINLAASEATAPPTVRAIWAERDVIKAGEDLTLFTTAAGSGSLTYVWQTPTGAIIATTAEPKVVMRNLGPSNSGVYRVTIYNTAGASPTISLPITVQPADPVILQQPERLSFQSGRLGDIVVRINAEAAPVLGTWTKDGRPWGAPSMPSAEVKLGIAASSSDAGTYLVTLRNEAGATVTSAPIVVGIDDSSRFGNLSTRAIVGTGERTLVAGFVIPPPARRTVLIRGIGPGLTRFGVENALTDPKLTVFNQSGGQVATNDDWGTQTTSRTRVSAATFSQLGAFALDEGSKDAALSLLDLFPGSYTVQLSPASGQTGVGLVEIYEHDLRADRIVNLSSRVFVGGNAAPAITGISIQGSVPKKVLSRAAGPALVSFGISGALENPRLTVKDGSNVAVAANDDWDRQPNGAALRDAAVGVGAFLLPTASKDAAVLITVAPGNYTVVVEGDPDQSGIVLLEVYEVN